MSFLISTWKMCSAGKVFHCEKFSLGRGFIGENYQQKKVMKFQKKIALLPQQIFLR